MYSLIYELETIYSTENFKVTILMDFMYAKLYFRTFSISFRVLLYLFLLLLALPRVKYYYTSHYPDLKGDKTGITD